MTGSEDIEVPESTAGDLAHAAVETAMGMVPVAGGPLAKIFSTVVNAPLEKRQSLWVERVTRELNNLINHRSDLSPERLAEDERFVTSITKATEAAIRTHEKEKIDALLGAVVSSAEGIDKLKEGLYYRFLDVFQAHHLKLLYTIQKHEIDRNGEFDGALEAHALLEKFAEEELDGDKVLLQLLTEELEAVRSLYTTETEWKANGRSGRNCLKLTTLGRGFLEFIHAHG